MNDLRSAEIELPPSIEEAVRATFGASARPRAFEPLRGGLSGAPVVAFTVRGRPYVARCARPSASDEERRREVTCTTIAAERGVAPRVLYASAERGVIVSERVDGITLGAWVRAGGDPIAALAPLLRTLHDGAPFPPFTDAARACVDVAAALAATGASFPAADACLARVEEMRAALAPHVVARPCHCDVNPGNVIVDAQGRAWLVDWDAACAGDPFHDLATPALFLRTAPDARARLLAAYLGREPTEIERARFAVTRALAVTFYALVFTRIGHARGGATPATSPEAGTPTGDPARYGEMLARLAFETYASAEHATALAALAG